MACKKEPPGKKPFLPGLMKVQVLYTSNFTPPTTAANVLHMRFSDGVNHSLADLGTAVTNFETFFKNHFQSQLNVDYSVVQFVLSSLGGDGLQAIGTVGYSGTAGGSPWPPQTAICISWIAALTARGGRARTYLPGIPVSATVTPGSPLIQGTYAAALKSAANGFLSDLSGSSIGGASLQLGVPSYYNNCQLRPVPLWFPFSGALIHERLDSQRRRSGKERIYGVV